MADINPSAENVRAMLTETLGRLRKASDEYFGLLEKGLSSSPLPIADQAKQFCEFMQRNVTATFDLGDKLSQAKDMQDALKIQSDFFQDQMRSLTDQGKSMGESAMKAATLSDADRLLSIASCCLASASSLVNKLRYSNWKSGSSRIRRWATLSGSDRNVSGVTASALQNCLPCEPIPMTSPTERKAMICRRPSASSRYRRMKPSSIL